MENLVWATILWLLVFLLIPIQRSIKLWPIAIISIFINLNYDTQPETGRGTVEDCRAYGRPAAN